MRKKVVIGLSGGIDSTISALLLQEQGFDVVGLHFSFEEEKEYNQLKVISDQLNIPVFNMDISLDFEIVKKHFVDEYFRGRTPSPCTFCNRTIKWNKLIEFADQNNCDYISSGHYIRKVNYNGFYHLQKGIDPVKDQSYFLWELNSEIINRMLTPLGDYTKNEVREIAQNKGFGSLLTKNESMGVCFLKNMDYRDFLRNYCPVKIKNIKKGIVKDESDNIIGTHEGYIYYTIGQKRGLTLNYNRTAYVSKINPDTNELNVGIKNSLNHFHIKLKNIHLVNSKRISLNSSIMIYIRGLGLNPEEPALIKHIDGDTIELELKKPAWAVAPGQPVVFYENDILLGGGTAEESW